MIHLRKIYELLTLLLVAFFLLCGPAAASDKTLTVGKVSGAINDTVSVPVTLNDPSGVGGVTFTMTYDPAIFEFQGLVQGGKVITDGSNASYTADELKNNLFYQENHGTAGRLLIAAAAADGLGTAGMVLLNARFKILGGNGEYPIGVVRTIIQNAAAGYAAPTFLPVLVGTSLKNASSGLYETTSFPVYPAILTAGSITVNAPKFNITGKVTYGETTTPAAGATVILKRSTAAGYLTDGQMAADSNGNYTFTGKVAGTYQVFVISNDPGYYNEQSEVFPVTKANVTVPEIKLPAPQRLVGSVTLKGGYLAGLQVKVMNGTATVGVYPVNADGTFQTPPLPPLPPETSYTLYAVYGSLQSQITEVGNNKVWTTTLYSIGGTITGLTGSATVTASSVKGKIQKTVTVTPTAGTTESSYSVGNLVPANDYVVSVVAAGMPVLYYNAKTDISQATAVDIFNANKTDANFDFTYINKGTIGGTITENSAGANIAVYAFETKTYALTQVNAVSGVYSFTLAPGTYEIFVIKANGKIFYYNATAATQKESAATILTLDAGDTLSDKNIDITECDNVLTGKVTFKSPDGDPAANVLITAISTAGRGIAVTGQDGTYTIGGLCAATYVVEMNPLNGQYAIQSETVTVPPAAGGGATQDFVIDTGNVLSGKITTDAADTTTPVGNAMIYLLDQETGALVNGRMYFSNGEGNYTIADIPDGIDTLNVTHPLYRSYSEANLIIETDTTKNVSLVKGAWFDVTVKDGSNGNALLPGALVIVTRSGALPVYALTDVYGNCKMYGFDENNHDYLILVQKRGYERVVLTGQTPSSAGTEVSVTMTKPAATFNLSGTITSGCTDNPPVVGAYVVVSTADKKFFASAVTNALGYYSFTNLPQASDYRLVVVPGGALRTQVQPSLDYTGSATQTNNVVIPCGSTISGTVTAGAGGASIHVFLYTSAGQFVGYALADGAGAYSFAGLAAGNYKVLAVSAGFTPKWYDGAATIDSATEVAAGGIANITLTP